MKVSIFFIVQMLVILSLSSSHTTANSVLEIGPFGNVRGEVPSPIKIESVKLNGVAFNIVDAKLVAEPPPKVLRTLEIQLVGTKGKPISKIVLDLILYKGNDIPEVFSIPFTDPSIDTNAAININRTMKAVWNFDESNLWNAIVSKFSNLDRVELLVGMVHFDGDLAWSKGSLLKRDPSNPVRWINLKYWHNYENRQISNKREIFNWGEAKVGSRFLATSFVGRQMQPGCYDLFFVDYQECQEQFDPCTGGFCPQPREESGLPSSEGYKWGPVSVSCLHPWSACFCCYNYLSDCPVTVLQLGRSCREA